MSRWSQKFRVVLNHSLSRHGWTSGPRPCRFLTLLTLPLLASTVLVSHLSPVLHTDTRLGLDSALSLGDLAVPLSRYLGSPRLGVRRHTPPTGPGPRWGVHDSRRTPPDLEHVVLKLSSVLPYEGHNLDLCHVTLVSPPSKCGRSSQVLSRFFYSTNAKTSFIFKESKFESKRYNNQFYMP